MSTTYPIKDKMILESFKNYYLLKNNPRNYALIIMGLNTALRINDILTLKWKDVYNFDKKIFKKHLCLNEQKTGKASMIAINPSVIQALTLILNTDNPTDKIKECDSYLFKSMKNKDHSLSRFQAYRIIRNAACSCGIEEHISCHSLRKTFGYFAWKQGVPPAMLMNIYNHSSYQITKRYLCIEQEDRDEIFLKIKI